MPKLETAPHCPKCNKLLDGATSCNGDASIVPKEGDVSVCLYCRTVLQFNKDMMLEEASAEVIEETMLQISQAQNAINRL